jgi:hypothetical protein
LASRTVACQQKVAPFHHWAIERRDQGAAMKNEKGEQKRLATIAKIITMELRNSMEDFHVKHLTDDQMKELNPIIRNAIYSALVLLKFAGDENDVAKNQNAIAGVSRLLMMVPKYWEEPELTADTRWTLESNIGAEISEAERKRMAKFCREYLGITNSSKY